MPTAIVGRPASPCATVNVIRSPICSRSKQIPRPRTPRARGPACLPGPDRRVMVYTGVPRGMIVATNGAAGGEGRFRRGKGQHGAWARPIYRLWSRRGSRAAASAPKSADPASPAGIGWICTPTGDTECTSAPGTISSLPRRSGGGGHPCTRARRGPSSPPCRPRPLPSWFPL